MTLRPLLSALLCTGLCGQAFGQQAMGELKSLQASGAAGPVYDGSLKTQGESALIASSGSPGAATKLELTGAHPGLKPDGAKAPPKPAGEKKPRSTTGGQVRGSIIGFLMGFATGAVLGWGLALPLLAVLAIGVAAGVPAALIGNDVGKHCALDDECG